RQDGVARHNSLRTTVWEQRLDDIAIYEAVLISRVTGKGELVGLSSQFVAGAAQAAEAGTPNRAAVEPAPPIPAVRAILIAAENIGEKLLPGEITPWPGPPTGNERRQLFKAGSLPGLAQTRLTWL